MRFTRCKIRITSFLMALALFGAGLMVAFHHHEAEARGPEHCATCHIGQQAKIGVFDGAAVAPPLPDFFQETLIPAVAPRLVASAFLLGKLSQAPPVLSRS